MLFEQVQHLISKNPSVTLENKVIENNSEQYSSKNDQQKICSQQTIKRKRLQ